jgi:exonuclease VII small subunit
MAEERIALTGKAKETVTSAVQQMNQLNQAVNNFIQGFIVAKELDGTWKLDSQTMELVKQEEQKPEQPKAEG